MSTATSRQLGTRPQARPGFVLRAFAVGLLIGVLTIALQKVLPYPVSQIANSGAVWIIVAYLFGRFAHNRSNAVMAGILAPLGEVIGYYAAAYALMLLDLSSGSLAVIGMWALMALVAGTLFGLAGYVAFHQSGWVQSVGRATLGAAFIGEGLYFLVNLSMPPLGVGWLVAAIVITALLAWHAPRRGQVWLIFLGLGLLAFGGEQLLTLLDNLRAANVH